MRFQELNATILNSNLRAEIPEMKPVIDLTSPSASVTLPNGAIVSFLGYLTEETETNMRIVAKGEVPVSMVPITEQAIVDVPMIRQSSSSPSFSSSSIMSSFGVQPAGADAVILLTHQFVPNDVDTLRATGKVNALLGGHEHDPFLLTVGDIPLLKAGNDMEFCGIVYLDILPRGDDTTVAKMEMEEKMEGLEGSTEGLKTFISTFYDAKKASTGIFWSAHSPRFNVGTTAQIASIKDFLSQEDKGMGSNVLVEEKNCEDKPVVVSSIPSSVSCYLSPYPALERLHREGLEIIEKFGSEVLYRFPSNGAEYCSRDVRSGPNLVARFLCDVIRSATTADFVCLPSGKVRGNKDYCSLAANREFTFVDALAELPFSNNEFVIVTCTGDEVYRVLSYSTAYHISRGGYLQTDSDVVMSGGSIISIAGEPFDPKKTYKMGAPLTQLKGMDNNPMLQHIGQANGVEKLMVDDLPLLQHIVVQQLRKNRDGKKNDV